MRIMLFALSGTRHVYMRGLNSDTQCSLGVLQHDDVLFTPRLPAWKREAIHSMSMVSFCFFALKSLFDNQSCRVFTRRYFFNFRRSSGLTLRCANYPAWELFLTFFSRPSRWDCTLIESVDAMRYGRVSIMRSTSLAPVLFLSQ